MTVSNLQFVVLLSPVLDGFNQQLGFWHFH